MAALVQELGKAGAGGSSLDVTLAAAPAAGHGVTMRFGFRASGTVTATSVTDSKGNTWTIDVQQNSSSGHVGIAHTNQDVATLAAGDTVTLTLSGTASNGVEAIIDEFDVALTADQVSATGSASAGTARDGGTTPATTTANELVVGAYVGNGAETSFTPGAGFSAFTTGFENAGVGTNSFVEGQYRFVTATGTQQAAATGGFTAAATRGVIATYSYTAVGGGGSVPTNTAVPVISGTAQVGDTLTTDNGSWTDTPTSYSYQWNRSGAAISGATGSSYTLVGADDGHTITVDVVATNGVGDSSPATSAATASVTYASPSATVSPTITGTATVGSTLTCSTGTWVPAGATMSFAYQWKRDGVDIAGETASTYVVQAADAGTTITCYVIATDDGGTAQTGSGNSKAIPGAVPSNTAAPAISGTDQVGSTLTVSNGTWSGAPTSYSYQWHRDGVDIAGATSSTYLLAAADEGTTISATVTATNANGSASADAAGVGPISAAPASGYASYDAAVAANFVRPTFTPARSVPFTTKAQLDSALANIRAGDRIFYNGTGILTISGEYTGFVGRTLASYAEIDLGDVTSGNYVKFTGSTDSSAVPAVWIYNASYLRIYGGWVTNPTGGKGILIYAPCDHLTWWDFKVDTTGEDSVCIFPTLQAGGAGVISDLSIKGEVTNWGILSATNDPHAEKGTGLHACNIADVSGGTVQRCTVALDMHDADYGSGIELGADHVAGAAVIADNTFYLRGKNMNMVAQSQTAANVFQTWGGVPLTNTQIVYIEGDNIQGRVVDTEGNYSASTTSGLVTVQQGVAVNTNQNPYLGSTEGGVAPSEPFDTRGGIIYLNHAVTPGGPSGAKEFGHTAIGSVLDSGFQGYRSATKYTLTEDAIVTDVSCWMQVTTANGVVRGMIHADSAGAPGALLATTTDVSVVAGTDGEVTATILGGVHLAAGDYWIAFGFDDNGAAYNVYCDPVGTGTHVFKSGSTAVDPFGTPDGTSSTGGAMAASGSYNPTVPQYIGNPGAETDTSDTAAVTATVARDTTAHRTGSASFKVTPTGSSSGEGIQFKSSSAGDIPISQNETATLVAYVKGAAGRIVHVTAYMLDGSGSVLRVVSAPDLTLDGTSWLQSSLTATAKAGEVAIRPFVVTSETTAVAFNVDDVSLQIATSSAVAPSNTVAPAISGTPQVGQTLSGSDGTWDGTTPISFAYQWFRDGNPISGATAKTYTLAAADNDHTITFKVTASNSAGTASATSAGKTVSTASSGGGGSADGFLPVLGVDGDPNPAFPEIRVSVAFDSNPRDYPQVYTPVTQYVREVHTGPRGRQPLADRTEAAQLTMTLDNAQRTFDPTNAAGPYYGKLKPNKRVLIEARWNSVVYPVLEALVDEWPQQWKGGGVDAIVSMSCTDKFKMLGRMTLPGAFSRAVELPGARVGAVLDAAGQPSQERNIDVGNSQVVALNDLVVTLNLTSGSAVATADDTSMLAEGMAVVSGTGIAAGTSIVSVDSGTQVTLSATATATGAESIEFFDPNANPEGDGLSVSQKTSDSERGLLFVAADGTWRFQDRNFRLNTSPIYSFGDAQDGGEIPYVDVVPAFTEQDIANDIHVTLPGQPETVSGDGTSQDENGTISMSIDTYLFDRNQAQAIGDYELSKRKDATTRIDTLQLDGAADPELMWPVILALEISDHVIVARRPIDPTTKLPVGAPQSYECYVENISHSIRPGQWTTTVQLSPADTSTYWVLGTSVLGTDTRLAV